MAYNYIKTNNKALLAGPQYRFAAGAGIADARPKIWRYKLCEI
jgi:hypothetical protein